MSEVLRNLSVPLDFYIDFLPETPSAILPIVTYISGPVQTRTADLLRVKHALYPSIVRWGFEGGSRANVPPALPPPLTVWMSRAQLILGRLHCSIVCFCFTSRFSLHSDRLAL